MARGKNQKPAHDNLPKKLKKAVEKKSKDGETPLASTKVKAPKRLTAWEEVKKLQKATEPHISTSSIYRIFCEMMQAHGENAPETDEKSQARRKHFRIQKRALQLIKIHFDAEANNLFRVAKLLSVRLGTSRSRTENTKPGSRHYYETRKANLAKAAEKKESSDPDERAKAQKAIRKLQQLKEKEKAMPYPCFRGDPSCMPRHLTTASYLIQNAAHVQ